MTLSSFPSITFHSTPLIYCIGPFPDHHVDTAKKPYNSHWRPTHGISAYGIFCRCSQESSVSFPQRGWRPQQHLKKTRRYTFPVRLNENHSPIPSLPGRKIPLIINICPVLSVAYLPSFDLNVYVCFVYVFSNVLYIFQLERK